MTRTTASSKLLPQWQSLYISFCRCLCCSLLIIIQNSLLLVPTHLWPSARRAAPPRWEYRSPARSCSPCRCAAPPSAPANKYLLKENIFTKTKYFCWPSAWSRWARGCRPCWWGPRRVCPPCPGPRRWWCWARPRWPIRGEYCEPSANHSSPAVLAVEVVLPLLVGVRQHGVRGAQLLELLSCLLVTRVLKKYLVFNLNKYLINLKRKCIIYVRKFVPSVAKSCLNCGKTCALPTLSGWYFMASFL